VAKTLPDPPELMYMYLSIQYLVLFVHDLVGGWIVRRCEPLFEAGKAFALPRYAFVDGVEFV